MVDEPWTQAMDERLLAAWRGGASARQIYLQREFPGRTRNAIIGRLWRLRRKQGADVVTHRSNEPVPKKRKRPPRYDTKRDAVVAPTPVKVPPEAIGARRLPLLELKRADCRFIVTDHTAPVHLYCAVDASDFVDHFGNNCYCAFHQRLMRAPIGGRR